MMFVSMLLEMLGIGLVLPALAFLSNDPAQMSNGVVGEWLAWLGHPTQSQLLLGGLLLLLAIYVVKSAFLLMMHYWQSRFVAALQSSVSRRLFATYLAQPWTFHLSRNSFELHRNIGDVMAFASTCTSLLNMIAESLVMLGVVALLLVVEPVGAVVVGVLGVAAAWCFDTLTRARSRRYGSLRREHLKAAGQWLMQGLHGAKDVKTQGCENAFVEQFALHDRRVADAAAHQSFAQQLPRIWFELLAVTSLCVLAVVMVAQTEPSRALIPTLGVFATAAFRLLPSVNRLSGAIQNIRYSTATITGLKAELALPGASLPTAPRAPMRFEREFAVHHVTYRYPNASADALRDVSLEVPRGAAVGLIGGSGAGKSTLVDVVLGLLPPAAGCVTVDGVDVATNSRGWQSLIGYVPQSIYLCDDTIRRNVAFGVPDELIDDEAVSRALRAAQLDQFVSELPLGASTLVGDRGVRLSGGQRQRIGIARALYRDPPILVLDEATSALDNATEADVMTAVNALLGVKTLVIVAHRLTTVERCDTIYRLDGGRIVLAGSFQEVVAP